MPWLLGNHTCRNISTYQPNTSNKMSPTSFAPGGGVSLQTLGDGKGGQDQATIFAWNKSTKIKISKNHKQKSTTKHNHLIHRSCTVLIHNLLLAAYTQCSKSWALAMKQLGALARRRHWMQPVVPCIQPKPSKWKRSGCKDGTLFEWIWMLEVQP